jgi:hypothetical protein
MKTKKTKPTKKSAAGKKAVKGKPAPKAKKAAPKAKKAAPKAKKAAPKAKKAAPKAKATAKAPAKSATKRATDAYNAAVADVMKRKGKDKPASVVLGTLRLENYRKPFEGSLAKLTEAETAQLTAVVGADALPALFGAGEDSPNEMAWLEYMDVVDTKDGTVVANLMIWPYGDGAVVHAGTTKMIASIVQHGISPHETTGKAWMADFAKAWTEGAPRLGVSSPSHFGFDDEQTVEDDEDE